MILITHYLYIHSTASVDKDRSALLMHHAFTISQTLIRPAPPTLYWPPYNSFFLLGYFVFFSTTLIWEAEIR